MLSFGIDTAPQSFCHSFIALPKIRCSKSAKKSSIQLATVVMKTTPLVLSQFEKFLVYALSIVYKVSLYQKIISKCCKLMKLSY